MVALPALAAESESIGRVSQFKAGAFVERNGKTRSLSTNFSILSTDTLKTNASGRVTILLNDNSTVSVGPNSRLDMSDYAPSTNPFSALSNIVGGISDVVEKKNQEGFRKPRKPEGTVGVRGLDPDDEKNRRRAEKNRAATPSQFLEEINRLDDQISQMKNKKRR